MHFRTTNEQLRFSRNPRAKKDNHGLIRLDDLLSCLVVLGIIYEPR
jgi:hypothetical protein